MQRGFRQRTAQRQRQRQLAVRAAGSCALSLTIDWFRGIHESVVDVVLYSKTQKLERCIELKLVASWSDCPLRDSWLLVLSLSLHDLPSHWCTQNRNGLVPEARHGTVLQNSFCHGAGSSTRTVCVTSCKFGCCFQPDVFLTLSWIVSGSSAVSFNMPEH